VCWSRGVVIALYAPSEDPEGIGSVSLGGTKVPEPTVAQDPRPGREVRHRCRSRCGTDLPNFHTMSGLGTRVSNWLR
jgi:hypothetical protein